MSRALVFFGALYAVCLGVGLAGRAWAADDAVPVPVTRSDDDRALAELLRTLSENKARTFRSLGELPMIRSPRRSFLGQGAGLGLGPQSDSPAYPSLRSPSRIPYPGYMETSDFSLLHTSLNTLEDQAAFDRSYGQIYDYEIARPNYDPFAPSEASIEKLVAAAKDPKNKIASADDFLGYLRKEQPEFFRSPVYMYHSRSSQQDAVNRDGVASPQNAKEQQFRAISIGGRILMAVVLDPKHPTYHQVELAEALPGGGYRYARLGFPGKNSAYDHFTVEDQTACVRCHGDRPRPIWQGYPLWPGALGGNHDELTVYGKSGFESLPEKALETALARKLSEPGTRYSLYRRTDTPTQYVNLRNVAFTNYLAGLNFHQAQAQAQLEGSKEFYQRYKYALYGTMLGCGDVPGFLPPTVRQQHERRLGKTLPELAEETKQIQQKNYDAKYAAFLELNGISRERATKDTILSGDHFDTDEAEKVAAIRYLIEGQGVDPQLTMRHWSTDFQPGRNTYGYTFSTPSSGFGDYFRKALWQSARTDPDFKMPESCGRLRAASLAALAVPDPGKPHNPALAAQPPATHR